MSVFDNPHFWYDNFVKGKAFTNGRYTIVGVYPEFGWHLVKQAYIQNKPKELLLRFRIMQHMMFECAYTDRGKYEMKINPSRFKRSKLQIYGKTPIEDLEHAIMMMKLTGEFQKP